MADSMPGLGAALRLFDAGERAFAPLPSPTSSQRAKVKPPPSTAPARMIAAPGPSSTEPHSAISLSALQCKYRFDFGIHTGKTLDEVPLDYLEFLKKKGIVEGKPSLSMAVTRYERLHPLDAQIPSSGEGLASFTLKLDKYAGKRLDQVPADYLNWLRSSNFYDENPEMRRAFAHLDNNKSKAVRGASQKRKRTPGRTSTTYAGYTRKRRSTLPREMPEWFGEFLPGL
ncbi:hypothetical protein BKA63DRAFT_164923 [Paraphoma chrysanthemicola]|nr:hypothetical protein BKA63DRAFT_164923 [Paraphoma chrysanthemicola]